MRTFTVLLVVDTSLAFVPAVRGVVRQRPLLARSSSRSSEGSTSRSSGSTPPWRYELDDLIKAASPWGSVVEAEIIATDLGDFPERERQKGQRKERVEDGRGVSLFCSTTVL